MRTGRALLMFLSAAVVTLPAAGQSVISTHSGVIYYFDGAVYLGEQPLQARLGTFPAVPPGVDLRTARGHAEILLTPGVFLRLGENSEIRMISNSLANTQVELRSGSAILDAGQSDASQNGSGQPVTLIYKNWQIRAADAGSYRLDSDPARLWVRNGRVEVASASGAPVKVGEGQDLPFAKVLVPEQSGPEPADDLSSWNQGRADSIVADNAITQQIDSDPATQSADVDGFSYFPMLGMPSPGLYSTPYSSPYAPIQPGFYSMYLPGYTYQPLLLGLIGRGSLVHFQNSPVHLGTFTGITHPGVGRVGFGHVGVGTTPRPAMPGSVMPRPVMPHPVMPRPVGIPAHPMAHPMIRH